MSKEVTVTSSSPVDPTTAPLPDVNQYEMPDLLSQGRTSSDTGLLTLNSTRAFLSNFKPYEIPDPLSKCSAAASSTSKGDTGHPTKGNGDEKPWEREPDKYVMMKSHRPAYDNDFKFHIFTTEYPILITNLRPVEQMIAYDAMLLQARACKIPEYYTLHLSHLVLIQKAIANEEEFIDELRAELTEWRRMSVGLMIEQSRRKRAKEAFGALQKASKSRERFRAWERGVVMLVERCEGILQLEEGFKSVEWRKRA